MAPRGPQRRRVTSRPPAQGLCLADRELDILRDALHEHVNALAVDIGPRAPSIPDSLVRAANLALLELPPLPITSTKS
jgi:hypothetical protein